jgi:hypothetical protein
MRTAAIVLGAVVLFAIYFIFLAGGVDYPDVEVRDLNKEELFRLTEKLLE